MIEVLAQFVIACVIGFPIVGAYLLIMWRLDERHKKSQERIRRLMDNRLICEDLAILLHLGVDLREKVNGMPVSEDEKRKMKLALAAWMRDTQDKIVARRKS